MPITLDLPAHLEEDLREEAEKEGVAPTEHAALLLSICTALFREADTTPFREAVKVFLSSRSLDTEYVATVLEELVEQCLLGQEQGDGSAAFQQSAAGGEERWMVSSLRAWRNSRVHQPIGALATPAPSVEGPSRRTGQVRERAMGKYAHVPGTSEDFAREKQEEIAREERRGA